MPKRIFSVNKVNPLKKRKDKIPIALREQVWIQQMGRTFEGKCPTAWCQNRITVFDFESGHNIPESKGGPTTLENLIPMCSRCNKSMGDRYTFDEWSMQHTSANSASQTQTGWRRYLSCFLISS